MKKTEGQKSHDTVPLRLEKIHLPPPPPHIWHIHTQLFILKRQFNLIKIGKFCLGQTAKLSL